MIIFIIDSSIDHFFKYLINRLVHEMLDHNFPDPKVMFSGFSFCLTNSQNPQNILYYFNYELFQYYINWNDKTEKILTFQKLKPASISHFTW